MRVPPSSVDSPPCREQPALQPKRPAPSQKQRPPGGTNDCVPRRGVQPSCESTQRTDYLINEQSTVSINTIQVSTKSSSSSSSAKQNKTKQKPKGSTDLVQLTDTILTKSVSTRQYNRRSDQLETNCTTVIVWRWKLENLTSEESLHWFLTINLHEFTSAILPTYLATNSMFLGISRITMGTKHGGNHDFDACH